MKNLHTILFFLGLWAAVLSATEFTICSYNCGGLSDHYDYLRAASYQKLMQERFDAEPHNMALNEKIQQVALKLLFGKEATQHKAKEEWNQNGYQQLFTHLTNAPTRQESPNAYWHQKAVRMLTDYDVRPVVIYDREVVQMLTDHIRGIMGKDMQELQESLTPARAEMARRIFKHHLKYDIICLQEADYLDASLFPEDYEVVFSSAPSSLNGIAWKKERFAFVAQIGDIKRKAFVLELKDKESGKKVLIGSCHLSGCNPFQVDIDPFTGASDSEKGDHELQAAIALCDKQPADINVLGMDSNVTAWHPRLTLLKEAGYELDAENHLEPTCTNPYQVLQTRIDWIALKPSEDVQASITNIPVLNVGLNSIQTNFSDHKPIAAKIQY